MDHNDHASPMDPPDVLCMSSDFHQNLLSALANVGDQLQQIATSDEVVLNRTEIRDSLRSNIWEIGENYMMALGGVQTLITCLESQTASLDKGIESLIENKDVLIEERDVLIDRGHELNCRLGYNALERKLDESFTDLERFTSEEGAKCFRDEAEENVKRTNDLIRLANLRSCQMDRDTFHEMEKITNLFEDYETERGPFVQELDLFSEVRRNRISSWLSEPLSETDRERGENILDIINLEQRQRHMEAQVVKNALRMYSFNASLSYDYQDNLKRLEELTAVQNRVNQASGVNRILPRASVARENLFSTDKDSQAEGARGDGLMEEEHQEVTGKGLHRCGRNTNLAIDPVTEPEVVTRLETALRWEENDGAITWLDQVEGGAEHLDQTITTTLVSSQDADNFETATDVEMAGQGAIGGRSSSDSVTGLKKGDSNCGDALGLQPDDMEGHKVEGGNLSNMSIESKLNSQRSLSYLSHIESQPVLPTSAERQIAGLVRRKHSGRQVGSLTNVQDTEVGTSGLENGNSEERDTRSQGSESASSTRPVVGGNRSRENVPRDGAV